MIDQILKLIWATGRVCTATRMQGDCVNIQAALVDRRLDLFDDGGFVGSEQIGKVHHVTDLGACTAQEAVKWMLS